MDFILKAKLTIVSEKDGSILIPGAIYSYSNKLLDRFNNVPTNGLFNGTMTKTQFITKVLKEGESTLGSFVAMHFISTHKDLSFDHPWIVKYDFMSLEIQ